MNETLLQAFKELCEECDVSDPDAFAEKFGVSPDKIPLAAAYLAVRLGGALDARPFAAAYSTIHLDAPLYVSKSCVDDSGYLLGRGSGRSLESMSALYKRWREGGTLTTFEADALVLSWSPLAIARWCLAADSDPATHAIAAKLGGVCLTPEGSRMIDEELAGLARAVNFPCAFSRVTPAQHWGDDRLAYSFDTLPRDEQDDWRHKHGLLDSRWDVRQRLAILCY